MGQFIDRSWVIENSSGHSFSHFQKCGLLMEKHNSEEKPQNIFFFVQNFRKEQYSFQNIKRIWALMTSPEKVLNIAKKGTRGLDHGTNMINNL